MVILLTRLLLSFYSYRWMNCFALKISCFKFGAYVIKRFDSVEDTSMFFGRIHR